MKVSVNCPSYKRPVVETLDYLPFCKVWVDPSEVAAYREANENAEIVECAAGVQGNLCRVRNHILDREFAEGADVVLIIDDDMKGLYYWEDGERVLVESEAFAPTVEKYSRLAAEWGAKFWGVNVSFDKQFYRENTPFSTVSYIGGPFQCFLKGNELRYDERLPLKEDYDMTLQQLNRYRIALRVNKYFYVVKQAKQSGGCATYRNHEREAAQLDALQKKWGRKIVKVDTGVRNHMMRRDRVRRDFNPVIRAPIAGV
jgi:hypothetical protein